MKPIQETWTVSQLNQTVKKWLEIEFPSIWVEGEISNFKAYPSGHWYFCIKDAHSQINCVMFGGYNKFLKFAPKDGMQVKLRAKVSLYPERGQFQLIADFMEESGDGALKRAFELLKQKLQAEGLFDAKHKKALPGLAQCIGVVTSPQGAAIRDILITLRRRFPSIPVIIYPAQVQGTQAAQSICDAIRRAGQHQACDVLIVGRGGGSLEDLNAFNTEIVARAIHACEIPIISAVGHEVDVTIADFVADVRAATPTAAAELVSPSQNEWRNTFARLAQALMTAMTDILMQSRDHLTWLKRGLKNPRQLLLEKMQHVDVLQHRLILSINHFLKHQQHATVTQEHHLLQFNPMHLLKTYQQFMQTSQQQLIKAMQHQLALAQQTLLNQVQLLDTLNPLQTLARGYAIVKNQHEQIICNANNVQNGEKITVQLAKDSLYCTVDKICYTQEKHGKS